MVCPKCNYMMSNFDSVCPRCHGKGIAQPPPQPSPANTPPIPSPTYRPQPQPTQLASLGCLPLLGTSVASFIGLIIIYVAVGNSLGSIVWLGSCFWVLYDAYKVGARKGIVGHLGDMEPWGWFFACLILWVVGFPAYLLARPHFVEANSK